MTNVSTSLLTDKGVIIHEGTSGITLTATREGAHVETLVEYSKTSPEEMREMICVLLCMVEELSGERFVASCIGRYAEETNKQFLDEGGHRIAMIRGKK